MRGGLSGLGVTLLGF